LELREAERHAGDTLVGRQEELTELLSAVADARSGSGRLVLIGGEPGIGKTRLSDELASRVREEGGLVLSGRAWEDAGAPPYWPWVQALRSLLRQSDHDALRRQLGSGASEIARMLPELRLMLPDLEERREIQSDSARFQLFDSTTTFLRNAAAEQAMLMVIDDLQAADTPSILLLQFVASQLSQMRLLVVGTYRDLALTPGHPLEHALAEMMREPATRSYHLRGLDSDAVGQFIGTAAGVIPSRRAVAAVQRATNGNPLFVIEAVRLLTAEGRIDDVADLPALRIAVPAGIREVIARRIGHLDDAIQATLALGAVIGPEFSVELLRRVGKYGAGELAEQLDAATNSGLIQPVSGASTRFRFAHDLVRETLYEGLAPGHRASVHRRIGEALEKLASGAPEGHLAELAFHFFQAAQRPEGGGIGAGEPLTQRALDYALRAADQAIRSLAFEEAVRLRHMALAMLPLSSEVDDVQHAEIVLSLGDAQARAGDLEGSKVSFREAADIARRTGEVTQLARAAIGYGGRLPWTRPGRDRYVIPLLQDALVLLGGTDERLRVRLLSRLASAWRSSPERFEQSRTLSQQALDLARAIDDPSTLSYALAGRYWATWWPENPEQRRQMAQEMISVAESAGDAERRIDAQLMLYMAYTETGQMTEARAAEEEVRRLANALRQPSQLWLGVAPRALLALLGGDFPLAEELVVRELNWGDPITNVRDERSAGIMHTFLLRREQDRISETEPLVRAAVDEFPWYPLHRAALVQVLIGQGRATEARTMFRSLAANNFAAFYRDNEWLLGIALAAEACCLLEDAEAARVLYEQLAPFAGRQAIGHAEGSLGAVDRYLGLLAATRGQLDVAIDHLTNAIHVNEQVGARPFVAHSQHDLATVLRRRGTKGDLANADALEAVALQTATAIGAVALQAAIDGQVPGRTASALEGMPSPLTGRFHREGEYWTVTFDGETTRLRDSKGLQHLARLLAEPGREFHALDLAQPAAEAPASAMEPLGSDPFQSVGPRLDNEAKAAYRLRLEELSDEAREAETWNDAERAARARSEIEFLRAELAGALGLGGRDRKAGSAAERARLSVTRAIRSAMSRMAEANPALGGHLERTIRTGTFCSYQPDSRIATHWET
jgi:tetratricopeptide (TPR) repeat protein